MGIFQNTISPVIGKGNVITHDGGLTYEVVSDFGTNYYWTIKKTASGDEIQTRYSIEQLNTLPVRILTVINSKKVSVKSEQNLIFQKKTF